MILTAHETGTVSELSPSQIIDNLHFHQTRIEFCFGSPRLSDSWAEIKSVIFVRIH